MLTFVTLIAWMLLSDGAVNAIADPAMASRIRPMIDVAFAGVASLLLVVLIKQDRRGISASSAHEICDADGRAFISSIIRDRGFEIVFQPIIDLGTGRPVGFEALTRFDDGVDPYGSFCRRR